jgi:hypothetical protein
MSANFLNTNRNSNRFFFATTEAGEQDLSLEYGTSGGIPNLSTMSVALSGGGGSVVVNQAPQFIASQFVAGEQALLTGTDSTYFTMSTLTSSIVGVNISSDRQGGTGTTCIESYAGNGSLGGFEFLNRGLGSQLLSTGNVLYNDYLTGINRPGAIGVLGATGTMAVNGVITTNIGGILSTNITGAIYPTSKTNIEFQAGTSSIVAVAGSTSNQALYGNTYAPLFSTALTGLNPIGKTFVSVNWANALSTGSNLVTYKVGFSTATAFTNTLSTHSVPGLAGSFTPSDLPGATTPIGATLITSAVDPDGVNADGTGTLYVLAQLPDPAAAADLLYLDKGAATEPSRYAITWHVM